jgi:hypothetical protein
VIPSDATRSIISAHYTLGLSIGLSLSSRRVGGQPYGLKVPQRNQLGTAPKALRCKAKHNVGLLHIGGEPSQARLLSMFIARVIRPTREALWLRWF